MSLIYLEPKGRVVKVHNIGFDKMGNMVGVPTGITEDFSLKEYRSTTWVLRNNYVCYFGCQYALANLENQDNEDMQPVWNWLEKKNGKISVLQYQEI